MAPEQRSNASRRTVHESNVTVEVRWTEASDDLLRLFVNSRERRCQRLDVLRAFDERRLVREGASLDAARNVCLDLGKMECQLSNRSTGGLATPVVSIGRQRPHQRQRAVRLAFPLIQELF